MTALLQFTDVVKTFGEGATSTTAANHVSFSVEEGSIVGLVGESGSGKSTIANLVLGLVEPDSGSAVFDGREIGDWLRRDHKRFRRNVQAVFQRPLLALDRRRTIGWSVAEPLVIHKAGVAGR